MAESMQGLKRTHRCAELSAANVGETVTIMGWVQKNRNKGGLVFTDVRDRSGIIQVVCEEGKTDAALIEKAQAHPDKYTIIDMTIAGGAALQKVMTLATGGFWDFDEGLFRFQGRNTYDAEQPREQESFQEALSWVFQAAEEFEQMDLRGRMKMLGVKVSRIRASEIV